MLDFGGLGDVGLHGDGLASGGGDLRDDLVGAGLAGGVVDDDRRAFGGEVLGDGGADAFGGSGDDGDFPCEFVRCAHWLVVLVWENECDYLSNNKD